MRRLSLDPLQVVALLLIIGSFLFELSRRPSCPSVWTALFNRALPPQLCFGGASLRVVPAPRDSDPRGQDLSDSKPRKLFGQTPWVTQRWGFPQERNQARLFPRTGRVCSRLPSRNQLLLVARRVSSAEPISLISTSHLPTLFLQRQDRNWSVTLKPKSFRIWSKAAGVPYQSHRVHSEFTPDGAWEQEQGQGEAKRILSLYFQGEGLIRKSFYSRTISGKSKRGD